MGNLDLTKAAATVRAEMPHQTSLLPYITPSMAIFTLIKGVTWGHMVLIL